MLDLNRTLQLVKGALFDAEATWRAYLPEAASWQKTAFLLTGPLIVAAAVLAYLLGLLGSEMAMFGRFRPTIVSSLASIVSGAIAAGVVAFIFSGISGAFGGKSSFALGLAATTFAFVPGYLGQALIWFPWIGGLLSLGLFVYALILLWRIIPLYLEVPDSKRAGHYILSIVATIAVMFLVFMLLRPVMSPAGAGFGGLSDVTRSADDTSRAGGLFGGVAQQAELMAAAEEDRYSPPSNGRLKEDQVEDFIRVMNRTTELLDEKGERIRELAEKAEKNQQASISDMSQMMTGMSEIAGMNTVEIEVVKSAGGNWAEHQWVKQALRTAWMQKDINEAVAHNYELYQEYKDELTPYVVR